MFIKAANYPLSMEYTIIDVSPNEMQGTYVITAQAHDQASLVIVAPVDAKIAKTYPSKKAKAAIQKALDEKYNTVNGSTKKNTPTFNRKQFIGRSVGSSEEIPSSED